MSAHFRRRELELLRDRLSERDLDVLGSVAQHRFLTARHVEQFHFDDHATEAAGARVCRRVLARLTRERVLARLQRRLGGVRAGSSSFVYGIGPLGRRVLGIAGRLREPSLLFLDHTLAIADARLELILAHRHGRLELIETQIEPAAWRRYTGVGGAAEIVRPDLYVVTAAEDFEHCWFLEVDRGTESATAIVRKCRTYEQYRRTGREQQEHGAFPFVVWVAPDERRARKIEAAIKRARGLRLEAFRSVAAEEMVDLLAGGAA